jgi:uncharacterized phage protein (TIGR01671 family)
MEVIKARVWKDDLKIMLYFNLRETAICFGISPTMMFTGLLDRNGKEIYEGDVVRYHWTTSTGKAGISTPREVRFGECSCNANEYELYGYYRHDPPWNDILTISECKNIEVIGNIYENSELLEGCDGVKG